MKLDLGFAFKRLSRLSPLFFVLISFFAPESNAKIFRNAYVQFELPEQWNCNPEGTEWVCSSTNKIDSKESIIILTAKEVGPQDSFSAYQNYLKSPKVMRLPNGKSSTSQVKNVRIRKINDHQWVDSLHLSSEIPGYYTRYVATIKDKLAILVSLSAHSSHYTRYSNDFFKAVESLRVVASKDILTPRVLAPLKPGTEAYGTGIATALPPEGDTDAPLPEEENSSQSGSYATYGGIALLLLAIGFYLFLKKN